MASRVFCNLALLHSAHALRRSAKKVGESNAAGGDYGPAPDDASILYFRAVNGSDIVNYMPECAFYESKDLARKVPDQCCDVSAWPKNSGFAASDAPDSRANPFDLDDTDKYNCYVRERVPAPGTYVRNSFACQDGTLTLAEGCEPEGVKYPMNAADANANQILKGNTEVCNCDPHARYRGNGCFVALSGAMFGIPGPPTANFVKVSGSDCQSGSALSQSEETDNFPWHHREREAEPELPATSDPGSMRGYTGPAENPGMIYMVMMDVNEIPQYQPQCASTFEDDTIGTKMPDECCEPEKWRGEDGNMPSSWFFSGPDIMSKPGEEENWTCYPRVSPGPFTGPPNGIGPAMQWIRNYIGCEDGKLQAHENCVPDAVKYVTQAQYEAGSGWSYPMNETFALTQFEDITGDECHCSVQSHFNEGAGCYIAYAKLAQFTGAFPAVYVKVEGTCNAPPNTRRRRRRSTGRRRNLMDILP